MYAIRSYYGDVQVIPQCFEQRSLERRLVLDRFHAEEAFFQAVDEIAEADESLVGPAVAVGTLRIGTEPGPENSYNFV